MPVEWRPARVSLPSRVPAALLSKAPPGTGSSCPSFSPQTRPRPPGGAGLWQESAGLEPGRDFRSVRLGRMTPGWKKVEVVRSGLDWDQYLLHRTEFCCRFEVER